MSRPDMIFPGKGNASVGTLAQFGESMAKDLSKGKEPCHSQFVPEKLAFLIALSHGYMHFGTNSFLWNAQTELTSLLPLFDCRFPLWMCLLKC